MSEENISQELRLKNMDETRNYSIEEINRNELMSKKQTKGLYYSKLCLTLSYASFYNYWMCFHFCFCFLSWYPYRNDRFCN